MSCLATNAGNWRVFRSSYTIDNLHARRGDRKRCEEKPMPQLESVSDVTRGRHGGWMNTHRSENWHNGAQVMWGIAAATREECSPRDRAKQSVTARQGPSSVVISIWVASERVYMIQQYTEEARNTVLRKGRGFCVSKWRIHDIVGFCPGHGRIWLFRFQHLL